MSFFNQQINNSFVCLKNTFKDECLPLKRSHRGDQCSAQRWSLFLNQIVPAKSANSNASRWPTRKTGEVTKQTKDMDENRFFTFRIEPAAVKFGNIIIYKTKRFCQSQTNQNHYENSRRTCPCHVEICA